MSTINQKKKKVQMKKTIVKVKPIRARGEDMDENQICSRILLKRWAAWLNMVAKIVFVVFLIWGVP